MTENIIRDQTDSQTSAAAFLRSLGFDDAYATGTGFSSGIDVLGSGVVARVRRQMRVFGRPEIQQFYGIARAEKKEAMFFALSGFTDEGVTWADLAEVALFTFDYTGEIDAVNDRARWWVQGQAATSPRTPERRADLVHIM